MPKRLLTALAPLIPLAAACTTVATVRGPAQFIAAKAPPVVWVTTADHGEVALLSPRVRADTLGGLAEGAHYVEMPLSSVQAMRARQHAPRRTLFLLGGAALAVATIAYTVSHAAGAPSSAPCSDPDIPALCPNGTVP
jgi:hypothetical protein